MVQNLRTNVKNQNALAILSTVLFNKTDDYKVTMH